MGTWPAVIHLIGPPAAGKLTVGRAIVEEGARRGRRIVLLDNHRTANLIFSLIDVDRVRPVMTEVWQRVSDVREAVFLTIEENSPPDWSFVLTNVLLADLDRDVALAERVVRMAANANRAYVPVEVRCATEALLQRVPGHDRQENMKWIDSEAVAEFLASRRILVPDGALVLDTTNVPPEASARRVVDAVDAAESRSGY